MIKNNENYSFFYEKINFIIYNNYKVFIFGEKNFIIEITLNRFLNELSQKTTLSSFKNRIETTKKIIGLKYKIPLYINKNKILTPLFGYRGYFNIMLNSKEVYKVLKYSNKVKIIFYNGKFILLENDIKLIKNQLKKCNKIINYLNQ